MSQRPLGAQISAMLQDRGVDVIFGIPGVHNIEMYRGIEENGLTHILARHEQGAGFMADGYARATGRPGVAYVITGPGLTNIMTPMGQAYSDSVPLLVISSCLDETAATRGQLHQMLDQAGAAATVCDWSAQACTPKAAYDLIDQALSEFTAYRARPKHIQVPIALGSTPADPAPKAPQTRATPNPVAQIADRVLPLLKSAKRPLFIFGGGATHADCAAFAARFKAASFTSYAGAGLIAPGTPLHFGSYLGRPSSAEIIATADLVLAIGTELSENDLWRDELGHGAPLIRIDIDAAVLSDRHRADIQIQADSAAAIDDLLFSSADWQANTTWTASEVSEARNHWRAQADADRPGIVPICAALSQALPENTMIFSDMTQFAYVGKEVWEKSAPNLWHHPTGFGTLGYALPAAIGGKIGAPDQPVIAIAGDYGFQYTLQELGTAAEHELTLPIFLWDNSASKEIEDAMRAAQIAPVAVNAKNPDFAKLAAAYGVAYNRPKTLADLQAAATTALNAAGPTLIHMTPALTS